MRRVLPPGADGVGCIPEGDSVTVLTVSISRDEAREVGVLALLVVIGLRIGAGVVQMLDELNAPWTFRSLLGRFLAPVGSTMGLLTIGAVLLVVLSPNGSITDGLTTATRRTAATVAGLGVISAFYTLTLSYNDLLPSIWFVMINALAAATLGAAGWWIMRNFDGDR